MAIQVEAGKEETACLEVPKGFLGADGEAVADIQIRQSSQRWQVPQPCTIQANLTFRLWCHCLIAWIWSRWKNCFFEFGLHSLRKWMHCCCLELPPCRSLSGPSTGAMQAGSWWAIQHRKAQSNSAGVIAKRMHACGSTCSSDARVPSDFEAAQGREPGELLQAAVADVIQGRLVIDEQALQPWQHAQRDQIGIADCCSRQVQMQQLLCQRRVLSSWCMTASGGMWSTCADSTLTTRCAWVCKLLTSSGQVLFQEFVWSARLRSSCCVLMSTKKSTIGRHRWRAREAVTSQKLSKRQTMQPILTSIKHWTIYFLFSGW